VTEPAAGPEGLAGRLDELTDLVRRRLLDDRDKRRMLDDLSERLRVAEQGMFREVLHPLVVGVAQVLDRCDGYDGAEPDFAASVRDELLDLLGRHDVHTVAADGPVDPARHEVVGVVAADVVAGGESTLDGPRVHEVVRRGLRHGEWVFRPARVVAVVARE
jgi:hypothetical protein